MLQVILSTASVEIKKFNYYILILLYAPYYNYTVISDQVHWNSIPLVSLFCWYKTKQTWELRVVGRFVSIINRIANFFCITLKSSERPLLYKSDREVQPESAEMMVCKWTVAPPCHPKQLRPWLCITLNLIEFKWGVYVKFTPPYRCH